MSGLHCRRFRFESQFDQKSLKLRCMCCDSCCVMKKRGAARIGYKAGNICFHTILWYCTYSPQWLLSISAILCFYSATVEVLVPSVHYGYGVVLPDRMVYWWIGLLPHCKKSGQNWGPVGQLETINCVWESEFRVCVCLVMDCGPFQGVFPAFKLQYVRWRGSSIPRNTDDEEMRWWMDTAEEQQAPRQSIEHVNVCWLILLLNDQLIIYSVKPMVLGLRSARTVFCQTASLPFCLRFIKIYHVCSKSQVQARLLSANLCLAGFSQRLWQMWQSWCVWNKRK